MTALRIAAFWIAISVIGISGDTILVVECLGLTGWPVLVMLAAAALGIPMLDREGRR